MTLTLFFEFHMSSGLRPRLNRVIAGGSAPAPWVPFLCSCKEKGPKESTPPGLRRLRRFPRAAFASGGAHTRHPCRGCARSRSLARPCGPALRLHTSLGLTKGVLKTPPRADRRWVAQIPVGASRAPSKAGGSRETFDRARGASFAPGELGSRPAEARRTGNRERCLRAAKRPGRILFGNFLLCAQEKVTCCGSATHKYASPEATQDHTHKVAP